MVGKVTPKSETSSSPEEKLLRSIFGEKATDVIDSSLKLPSGNTGVVIDVRVFNRHGIEKDERSIAIERAEIESVQEDRKVEEEILNRNIKSRAVDLLKGKSINKSYKSLKGGLTLNNNDLDNLGLKDIWKLDFSDSKILENLQILKNNMTMRMRILSKDLKIKLKKFKRVMIFYLQ